MVASTTSFIAATPFIWPGNWGVGSRTSIVTKIEKNKQGNVIKETEVITSTSGKSLWDGLSLLGVPLSLAILGAWIQNSQREQAEKAAKEQREQTADETREDVLQRYFDRISALLIAENLMAIAGKRENVSPDQKELLDTSLNVIRARTLSILRRFENDTERKSSVIRFLAEAEIISKLRLNLEGANLMGVNLNNVNLNNAKLNSANLTGANLIGANFNSANLNNAKLMGAELVGADFEQADLVGANLNNAKLIGADFEGANLIGADLIEVDLTGANLNRTHLNRSNLSNAKLIGTSLIGADLEKTKLDGANLGRSDLEEFKINGTAELTGADFSNLSFDDNTIWPDKTIVAQAQHIPEALKKKLGILHISPLEDTLTRQNQTYLQ